MAKKIQLVDLPKDEHMDGWQNLITGIGTSQDKKKFHQAKWDIHSPEFFEQLYSGSYMASRIVNLVPEDGLRKGWEWVGVEKEITNKIEDRCQQLDLRGAIERTWKWGRAYGGACLYMVTNSEDPASPMQPGEQVIGLRDLSRYDLRILTTDVESDFGSPNWGHPKLYYLVVQMGSEFKGYPIHWTRMIRFDGYMVPRRTFIRNNYWHDSVLNRINDALADYDGSNAAAASILADFNVGIYKMKNLANLVAAGKEDVVKRRVELLNYSKSTIRAMMLDSDDEEFEDMSRSVEGLADLLTKMENRLVAATDIPHTKLLGESPDGSNATGNSTTNQWYDHIQSEQENYLRPRLKRLLQAIFFDVDTLDFKFKPLGQPTENEIADIRLKVAQSDQIYYQMGAIDPTEITKSRWGGDNYSIETEIDWEARADGLIVPGSALPETEPDPDKDPEDKKEFKKDEEPSTGLPDSLQPLPQELYGVTSQGYNPYDPRDEEIPGKDKVKAFISQTMSEPLRDPKTDPKVRQGGIPNKARVIEPTRGNGVTAGSGSKFKDAGESAIMPRGLDATKGKKKDKGGNGLL